MTSPPSSDSPGPAAPAPAAPALEPAVAPTLLIEPRQRIATVALFLIAQLLIPYVNSLVNAGLVSNASVDGVSRTSLSLVLTVNSFVSWLVLSGAQAVVLRKYLPAGSWFGMTIAGVIASMLMDAVLLSTVLANQGFGTYRVVSPILRWLLVTSSQWVVLRSRVRGAGVWIVASVGAAFGAAFLLNAAIDAGPRAILVFPWIGLSVGVAQCWCLVHFIRTRAETPR